MLRLLECSMPSGPSVRLDLEEQSLTTARVTGLFYKRRGVSLIRDISANANQTSGTNE